MANVKERRPGHLTASTGPTPKVARQQNVTSPSATASVWPSLGYRNAPHMIEWLVRAFGLSKDLVVAGTDGEIAHSELGWRGAVINVVSYTDGEDTLTTLPGKAGLYLVVEDPAAHHDRARTAGATIVQPLTDHEYGSRG
jgi:uncharacterized glyoxalase superfamily protein PhnB